ncbi:MAG: ABC transporter substrate-binding protein [Steroidobacteraceae bacterium]
MPSRRRVLQSALAAPVILAAPRARAAEPVKIGVIFPLTGNSASAGEQAKDAVEFGAYLVNHAFPQFKAIPPLGTAGLSNLGGAKIELDIADHRGNPTLAATDTLRLITQDHVVAMLGTYQSSTGFTATAVAERYGIPFVLGDTTAPNITGRGFQWTFRVGPIAPNFAATYMRFLAAMQKKGHAIRNISVVNENTDYGTSVSDAIVEAAKKSNVPLAGRIAYSASSTDLSTEALKIKQFNPTVAIFVSYTSDAILYMKAFKFLNWLPPMIIGDDSGFSDPSFIPTVGRDAQGVLSRSSFTAGKPGTAVYELNKMFEEKYGQSLADDSARNLEALLVLADAINRAGSTAPAKIQAALRATDLKADQVVASYRGVRFDKTGQNILGSADLVQLHGDQYLTVWPTDHAVAKLEWPMPGWRT